MYAITFGLDAQTLQEAYEGDYTNFYGDIEKILQRYGFTHQQGNVYFGDVFTVDAVTCVLAVIELTEKFPWFGLAVNDIRMLRIAEDFNLMPAVEKAIAK